MVAPGCGAGRVRVMVWVDGLMEEMRSCLLCVLGRPVDSGVGGAAEVVGTVVGEAPGTSPGPCPE